MLSHTTARNTVIRHVICLMLTGLLLTACGGSTPAKLYSISVVNYVPGLDPVVRDFTAQMAAFGYVEGQNVTYIYHGVLEPDPQVIEREVQRLLEHKIDLFLTLGTPTTLAAKKAIAGTTIPVVFAPVVNPIKEGVVESLSRPGGNVTGIQSGDTLPKALEWLHKIVPQAAQIHVMYHPKDQVAQTSIQSLAAIAPSLGIDLRLDEVRSPAEAVTAITTLPKDAAIFLVPTPSLEPLSALIEVAVQRGIAVGASNHSYLSSMKAGAVVSYAGSFPAMGQQAARLVDQIVKGTKPADLPVETAERFLHINLQTAAALDLDIPDELLRQADMVMR